jgi:hypothetical protein
MRMREFTASLLLMLMTLGQTSAGRLKGADLPDPSCPYPEEGRWRVPESHPVLLIPQPSALVKNDGALATAYYDAMRILGSNNHCSAFFGGSRASVDVFGNFMAGIRKDFMPTTIGLRMSGDYTNVLNAATQVKYRLFDKASLNSGGPFYRRSNSPTGVTLSGVGSFPANSRGARVLMLLHELGHLMRGADGKWLLPDDGRDMAASLRNTRLVESACGEEIRALAKYGAGNDLVRQNNSEQTVSPAAATSSHQ